jgi:signal transduction histidine kinase
LKVKAFFPSTSYAAAEFSYPFEIMPPWWQTWWFRSIAVLIIIGLLIIGFRFYYRRKLEKQMAALEKQQAIEKERTRIATDMHDDLGAGLSRIKFLSENVKANKGDNEAMLKDIEKISAYSDEMAAKMGEIVWALNKKNDTVADLVAFTRSYVLEYLSGQNIRCELNTPLTLPSTFITGEVRQHIFLSVKECLHNIAKHAGASQVYFSVKLNGEIEIIIHDNGKGINWNTMRPFSNGIQNIQRRMNEIHGKVTFLNEKGTKVIMSIPHEV